MARLETTRAARGNLADLLCFSHLRWNFVFQRPQHLLSRFARERRVFFFEEPVYGTAGSHLEESESREGVRVATPHLPSGLSETQIIALQRGLLNAFMAEHEIERPITWYYTPMALPFSRHLRARATAYDCMDELSGFRGAPASLLELEGELLDRADVVFTGGVSLYEAKQHLHRNIHACPSSVDTAHFARARGKLPAPPDQAALRHPLLGFFGVVDERLDLALVGSLAALRPDWDLVILGPVVKIDPATLPRAPNLHYLGSKAYGDLPNYLSGWDVALMPFALNESTRFISPTKTPEYLAAGKPVVSTRIRDVERPYGELGLVQIADSAQDFVSAIAGCLAEDAALRQPRVEAFLSHNSWDDTWGRMRGLLESAATGKPIKPTESRRISVLRQSSPGEQL